MQSVAVGFFVEENQPADTILIERNKSSMRDVEKDIVLCERKIEFIKRFGDLQVDTQINPFFFLWQTNNF